MTFAETFHLYTELTIAEDVTPNGTMVTSSWLLYSAQTRQQLQQQNEYAWFQNELSLSNFFMNTFEKKTIHVNNKIFEI
jgi:hypothetical protein